MQQLYITPYAPPAPDLIKMLAQTMFGSSLFPAAPSKRFRMTPLASPPSLSLSLADYFNMPPQPAQLQHQLQLQLQLQRQLHNLIHQPELQLEPQLHQSSAQITFTPQATPSPATAAILAAASSVTTAAGLRAYSAAEIAEALRISTPITAMNAADFCCTWTPAAVTSFHQECAAAAQSPVIAKAVSILSQAAGVTAGPAAATATTHQRLDHIEVHHQLLSSGADPLRATAAWVRNQYRWVVWKLAAYQRRYTHACGSFPLSAENILAQLKRRYGVIIQWRIRVDIVVLCPNGSVSTQA